MQRLNGFPLVIYDTNCLVYYCFQVDIPQTIPKATVTARQTEHTRKVTELLKSRQQKITTTEAAYAELKNCVNNAVEDRMAHREVEAQLGYSQGQKVPDQLKLHVQIAVTRHVTKLENKDWFVVDRGFVGEANAMLSLRQFFDSQSPGAYGNSKKPNVIDMELINFGAVRRSPLVTNDRGISTFSGELIAAGLGFQIHNLMELGLPD